MPRIRIETTVQIARPQAAALMKDVMDAIVEALSLLSDDRTVSIDIRDPALFVMKPPYRYFIEIMLFAGRSAEAKKRLFKAIINVMGDRHGIDGREVMIMLNEQPRGNWGLRGGVSGDELVFGYSIEK